MLSRLLYLPCLIAGTLLLSACDTAALTSTIIAQVKEAQADLQRQGVAATEAELAPLEEVATAAPTTESLQADRAQSDRVRPGRAQPERAQMHGSQPGNQPMQGGRRRR